MTIDTQWFVDRLAQRGMSQRGLAKLMGVDSSAVSLMFRGKRKMTLEEAAQLAVLLDTTPQEILERSGVRVPASDSLVKVIGYMQGDATVVLSGEGGHEMVEAPPNLPAKAVAIQARTAGTERAVLDGWMYFVAEDQMNPQAAIGNGALVAIKGNGLRIAHVAKGYRKGTYNLIDLRGQVTPNLELAWVSPVFWIKTVA
jgi:transcriptional regulator with XRE-family HTH domain